MQIYTENMCGAHPPGSDQLTCNLEAGHQPFRSDLIYAGYSMPDGKWAHADIRVTGVTLWRGPVVKDEARAHIPSPTAADGRLGPPRAPWGTLRPNPVPEALTQQDQRDERDELASWWRDVSDSDLAAILPKVTDYGSYDLDLIGRVQADMLGIKGASREVREELGCLFYLIGKVARMASAYRDGHRPSDDSLLDAEVYVKMIRRLRYAGGWPYGARSGEAQSQPEGLV